MKKFIIVVSILFALFTCSACNVGAGEPEPMNQLCKSGVIVSVNGEQASVDVGGDTFEFEGTNFSVGQSVKVFFDTNGEPTNPWVWWVIDVR